MAKGKPSGVRHANYEILNLIGYGLAKFDQELVAAFGFASKTAWFNDLVSRGVADTYGTIKNRQDLFNPLVRGGKVGWWQGSERYLHRKTLLDSLFGNLDVAGYAGVLASYLHTHFARPGEAAPPTAPVVRSMFRMLQETGREAELFFMTAYQTVPELSGGLLVDARLFGDGYDFQITVAEGHVLADVKGVREASGGVRLTQNEYRKAQEYGGRYCLAVVSRLATIPRLAVFFNPLAVMGFTQQTVRREDVFYTLPARRW